MSETTPFYHGTEDEEVGWLVNLDAKCGNYTAALQSTAAEIAQVKSACKLLIYVKGTYIPGLQALAEAGVSFRDELETGRPPAAPIVPAVVNFTPPAGSASPTPGLLTWLLGIVARWKTAETCTESIMTDLRIKSTSSPASTQPPDIKAKVEGGIVKVRVPKRGHKGFITQSCRQGEPAWVDLGPTTAGTLEDKRPVKTPGTAEWREYRSKFWDGSEPTGDWSEVVRVTIEG